jgi:hypothetical protein
MVATIIFGRFSYRLTMNRTLPALLLLLGLTATGCVPYVVGTTAQPVPRGEWATATSIYAIPGGIDPTDDTYDDGFRETGASFVGVDTEARFGIDDASDIGVRAPGGIGLVVNYKRRILGTDLGPALALMGGGGFINLANHAHLEFTIIGSGSDLAMVTPYGGLRTMYAIPMTRHVPSDEPSIGLFSGIRIGQDAPALSIELGVFYDPSATGIRTRDWIFVPSVTLHGRGLGRLFPF